MARYSQERKQAVVARMIPPNNVCPRQLAEEEGIPEATLYQWRRKARQEGRCLPDANARAPEGWSARDKFAAVLETASLSEHEQAEYCRARGIYLEQLKQWRADCERATELADAERQQDRSQARQQRKQVKHLEKELQRKEQALAETAALLTLRKKARAIWGEQEDE